MNVLETPTGLSVFSMLKTYLNRRLKVEQIAVDITGEDPSYVLKEYFEQGWRYVASVQQGDCTTVILEK